MYEPCSRFQAQSIQLSPKSADSNLKPKLHMKITVDPCCYDTDGIRENHPSIEHKIKTIWSWLECLCNLTGSRQFITTLAQVSVSQITAPIYDQLFYQVLSGAMVAIVSITAIVFMVAMQAIVYMFSPWVRPSS